MELHQRFLTNIRRRRAALGLTQADVADRLGIKQASYAAIESGRRNPGLDVVDEVAQALECDGTELLRKSAEKKEPIPA